MRPALSPLWRGLTLPHASKALVGNHDKQWAWIALLLLSIIIWMSGCQQAKSAASQAPPQEQVVITVEVTRVVTPTPSVPACARGDISQVNEVVIGAFLPLSKPGAMLSGFGMQTAIDLAVEDVNAAGGILGKPIHLITYDNSGIPSRGAFFAERLLREDCAAILVGGFHSEVAVAVKEVAHRYGVPVIFASPHADEITADRYPEVFRVAASMTMLAQWPGQWLGAVGDYNHDGAKLVLLVVENSNMGKIRAGLAQKWWPTSGFTIEPVLVDLPTTDFSPLIARIVAQDQLPDAIFILIPGEGALNLQRQLLDAGIGPQKKTLIVNNTSIMDEQAFWQGVPDGVYTVTPRIGPWPSTVPPLGRQFAQAYSHYFNHWPEADAFEAYDAVRLAADALTRAQSLDPAKIIAALETTDVELASGHYTFPYGSKNPPDGKRVPMYLWHQWLDPPNLFLQFATAGQKASDAPVIWPKVYRKLNSPLLPELKPSP